MFQPSKHSDDPKTVKPEDRSPSPLVSRLPRRRILDAAQVLGGRARANPALGTFMLTGPSRFLLHQVGYAQMLGLT